MYVEAAVFCILIFSLTPERSNGHGRLVEPPSRASMWRYGFDTPHNYNDNQLFCGGFNKQWNENGGKCGVCGDDYSDPQPRAHEGGGHYATGTIARTYTQGQIIDITIEITAQHLGWFEFRLCPHNDPSTPVTHECLNQNLLHFVDGSTQVDGINQNGNYHYQVVLPEDITCSQCVLQWKYHTGNSWGTDPDGSSGLGKGAQEEFYGCADVKIKSLDTNGSDASSTSSSSSTTVTTESTSQLSSTSHSSSISSRQSTKVTTSSTSAPSSTSESPTSHNGEVCKGTGDYKDVPGIDSWCRMNCAKGYCPPSHCKCSTEKNGTTKEITVMAAATTVRVDTQKCMAKKIWNERSGSAQADAWCQNKCNQNEPHRKCFRRCICS